MFSNQKPQGDLVFEIDESLLLTMWSRRSVVVATANSSKSHSSSLLKIADKFE